MTIKKAGNQGTLSVESQTGEFNALRFLVQSIVNRIETATLVKVISCTNSGGVSPVGFVTVQPLVDLVDSQNRLIAQPQVVKLPYTRIQGGANAVIVDPEPGDIGIAVFASRDISTVKSKKDRAGPGSQRKYHLSDGLYVGGVLNGTPTQYVQFNGSGITVNSPTKVHVVAPDVTVDASTSATVNTTTATVTADTASLDISVSFDVTCPASTFTGPLTVTGLLTGQGGMAISGGSGASVTGAFTQTGGDLSSNGTVLHTHTHGGVQTGTGNTGAPN